MTKEDRKNAFLYCKFRDEQFALYDEYAKNNGILMNTFLVLNVLFYEKDGITQKEICKRTFESKQTVNLIVKSLLKDGYVTLEDRALAKKKSGAVLGSAADMGAELLVTACPLCLYNLTKTTPADQNLPVLYFTELLAEALGVKD